MGFEDRIEQQPLLPTLHLFASKDNTMKGFTHRNAISSLK
jgi:hypothetical protein